MLHDQAVNRPGQPWGFEHEAGVQPVVALGRRPVFGERRPQRVEKMPELTSPVLGHRADQARTYLSDHFAHRHRCQVRGYDRHGDLPVWHGQGGFPSRW